jgi:hypothetical protein
LNWGLIFELNLVEYSLSSIPTKQNMSRLTLTTSRMIPQLIGRAFLAGLTAREIYCVKQNIDPATGMWTFARSHILYDKYYAKFDSYVRTIFTPSELDDLQRARINSVSVIDYHIKREVGQDNYDYLVSRVVKVGAAKVGSWSLSTKPVVKKENPIVVKPIKVNTDAWKHFTTVNYLSVPIVTV